MGTLHRTPVAGVDVGVRDRALADTVADRLAEAACRQGATSDRVVVGVHRAVATSGPLEPGFAFSVEIYGVDEGDVWSFVTSVADDLAQVTDGHCEQTEGVRAGIALGRRRGGPAERAQTASVAARAHESRSAGRVMSFPGRASLLGTLHAGDIVTSSAIDEVVDLAAGPLRHDDLVLVPAPPRPRWQFGSLVLHVLAAPGTGDCGVYLPFDRLGRLPVPS